MTRVHSGGHLAHRFARSTGPARVRGGEAVAGWGFPSFSELWAYRDLVYFLARRDVAARYKQTAVGALWALLQPLGLALAFTVFLGIVAGRPSFEDVPYPVFAFTGMTIWLFLANAVNRGGTSTREGAPLIGKVFFPRLALPLSAVIPPLIDFVVSFSVLIVWMLAFGVEPSVRVVLTPLILVLAFVNAFGLAVWLSATAVKYHDVEQLIPFMTLILLFMTPVVYPLSQVPDAAQPLYALNPLVGVLEGFRWAVLPDTPAPGLLLLIPVTTAVLLAITGLLYFHRREREFADII